MRVVKKVTQSYMHYYSHAHGALPVPPGASLCVDLWMWPQSSRQVCACYIIGTLRCRHWQSPHVSSYVWSEPTSVPNLLWSECLLRSSAACNTWFVVGEFILWSFLSGHMCLVYLMSFSTTVHTHFSEVHFLAIYAWFIGCLSLQRFTLILSCHTCLV